MYKIIYGFTPEYIYNMMSWNHLLINKIIIILEIIDFLIYLKPELIIIKTILPPLPWIFGTLLTV